MARFVACFISAGRSGTRPQRRNSRRTAPVVFSTYSRGDKSKRTSRTVGLDSTERERERENKERIFVAISGRMKPERGGFSRRERSRGIVYRSTIVKTSMAAPCQKLFIHDRTSVARNFVLDRAYKIRTNPLHGCYIRPPPAPRMINRSLVYDEPALSFARGNK